jgi:hypothetical protein
MPYTIGLHAAVAALLHGGLLMQFSSAVVILLFIYVVATSRDSYKRTDAPVSLPGSSLFYIYPFFRRKFDFLNWGFRVTGEKAFQFKLLNVGILFSCLCHLLKRKTTEHCHRRLRRTCS